MNYDKNINNKNNNNSKDNNNNDIHKYYITKK